MLTDDDRITREAQEAANDLQERVGGMTDEELELTLRTEVWSDPQAEVVHDEVRYRAREAHVAAGRPGDGPTDAHRDPYEGERYHYYLENGSWPSDEQLLNWL